MSYVRERRAELIGNRQRKPRRDSRAVLEAVAAQGVARKREAVARAAAGRLARALQINITSNTYPA